MRKYLIKRSLTMVMTFIGITIVVFAILRLAPGDPTQQKVDFGQRKEEQKGRAQQLIRFKRAHHLDKPLFLNTRPYRNFRPEMTFWLDFLSWHVPYRKHYLRSATGTTRDQLKRYLQKIQFPSPELALGGSDADVEQAARSAIRETLILNLADRSTWLIPLVMDEFQRMHDRFERSVDPLNEFRSELASVAGDVPPDERRERLEALIQPLREKLPSISVSPELTYLDRDVPLPTNIHILEAWLEGTSSPDGNPSARRREANRLLDRLRNIRNRLGRENLSRSERSELRQDARDRISTFRNEHGSVKLSEGIDSLNPARSYPFNLAVSHLLQHQIRRRLEKIIRLLNILTRDAFGVTFRMPEVPEENVSLTRRKQISQKAENVAFLWTESWWREHKDRFEDVSGSRRSEVLETMEELIEEDDDFRRRRKIRSRLKKSDLPVMIELLGDDERGLRIRAVASQVLIEFADAPRYYEMTSTSPDHHIRQCLTLWNRWWNQNSEQFTFSFPDKLWHTISQTQYSLYMWNLAQFNFGDTMSSPVEPVSDRLRRAIWRTGPLMLLATLFTYLMAIPLGVICAVKQRTLSDRGISVSLLVLWAIPGYAAAMILIFLFANPGDAGLMQLFPDRGLARYDQILRHLFYAFSGGGEQTLGFTGHLGTFFSETLNYMYHAFLPMFSISVFGMASLALYSRVSMLEVIRKDYIRTARAKGLSELYVIGKHVVRNGLNPIITLFANLLPRIVGGSLIIEIIFEIRGVGKMFFEAAEARDYNVMMCFLLITAVLVMVGILLSDLMYVLANPRLDFEEVE